MAATSLSFINGFLDCDHKGGRLVQAFAAELRHVDQLTFSHDAFMRLVGAFHAILKLAVAFWQFPFDDTCASSNAKRGTKEHGLADLEFIGLHDPSFRLVHY